MRNYDPAYGGEEHENAIQDSYTLIELARRYEEWLDMHPKVVDEAKTTIQWCNFRGLFDKERVKEFLNECSNTDGQTD